MDVDGAPEVWPGYAPVRPGYAAVWPGYAPVWGYVATSWKNDIFAKIMFFVNFSFTPLKLLANHEEQLLTLFGFLPPYSGVSRSLA